MLHPDTLKSRFRILLEAGIGYHEFGESTEPVNGISGDVKIVLSDARGRILRTINTEAIEGSLEQVIDVNDLAEGIYYIRIQNADINKTQKLIVK
jgi:hypothetical protein